MRLKSSSSTFVFADQRCISLGILTVLLDTPGSALRLDVDVVLPDIPILLGLGILDKYGLQFLNKENALEAVTRSSERTLEIARHSKKGPRLHHMAP
jgi:hypothetical protein